MLSQFTQYILSKRLVNLEDKILISASGGMDSMTLLDLFRQAKYDIGVAHINHALRGSESDKDEQLCRQYCDKHAIPFYCTQVDFTNVKSNFQEIARQKRRDYLLKVSSEHDYRYIATAHHQDDEIENLLLRLNRSAGLKGLSGMSVKSGLFIKPLLFASKEDITNYCKSKLIPYRNDATNFESKYERNYIRNEVIPKIEEKFPHFKQNASSSVKYLAQAKELQQYFIQELTQKHLRRKADSWLLNLEMLDQFPDPPYVLFLILRDKGLNKTQCLNLYSANTGIRIEKDGTIFLKDRDQIILKSATASEIIDYVIHEDDKEVLMSQGTLFFSQPGEALEATQRMIYIDVDKTEFPLRVRLRKKGDLFFPLGMGMKRKKLKKFFIDKKINQFEKDATLLLVDKNDQIIWVVGHRQDERFVANSQSQNIVKVIYDPKAK